MTKAPQEEQLWSMMPGWGIVADLTPPDLINSRQLRVIRKLILTGLIAILVLCLTGFVFAQRHESAAAHRLEVQQARQAQLQREAAQYTGITKIQGTVAEIEQKLATLMAGDVEFGTLVGQLRNRLPSGMTISQLAILIAEAGVKAEAGGLDTTGDAPIGNITLSGAGRSLVDLATYVDRLTSIAGVSNVIPTSNTTSKTGIQYNVTLVMTTKLLSHRFDGAGKGGK